MVWTAYVTIGMARTVHVPRGRVKSLINQSSFISGTFFVFLLVTLFNGKVCSIRILSESIFVMFLQDIF